MWFPFASGHRPAKKSRAPSRRKAAPARLAVEALESRWCPSCTVFQEGGTLFIRGDDAANVIEIRDDGFERGVSVQCDRDPARAFMGITQIVLNSFGGDDRVTHLLGGPDTTPADLRFELGRGDDDLTIDWINPDDGAPPRAEGRPVVFDVSTGAGNDRVMATFVNPPDGDFGFRADLGAGNDALTATYVPPDESDRDAPLGRVRLEGVGGAGADRLDVYVGDPSNGASGLNAGLEVRLDGGLGDDVQSVLFHKTEVVGALTLQMDGGLGDDIESVLFEDSGESLSPLRGPVSVQMTGGGGADEVGFIICRSQFLGPLDVAMSTGDGSDTGSIIINCGKLLGPVNLHMDTGGGDDSGSVLFEDLEDFGGEVNVQILTGRGNDRAAMTLRDSHDFTGTLDVLMDTADGDDRASLLIERCLRFGPLLNLSVDSGAGNDSNTVMISDSDAFEGFLNVGVAAGSGIDDITTIFGFNPQPDPPGQPLDVVVQIDAGSEADVVRAALDLGGKQNARLQAAVLGAGGDDDVALELSGIGNLDAVEARVDTGAGNDTFAAVFTEGPHPESPRPDAACLVSLDVLAGTGDDRVGVTFTDIVADVQGRVDLGAGNDAFQAEFAIPDLTRAEGPSIQQLDPGNRVGLEVFGREGGDAFGLTVGDRAGTEPHILNSDVTAHFDGGLGSDSAAIAIVNVTVNGALSATVDLGAGDDLGSLETTNAVLNGPTTLSLFLGAGDDVMGWQNQDVLVNGALVVAFHGGAGDDSMQVRLQPRVNPDGLYQLHLFGDDGDDRIDVRLEVDPESRGRIVAELFGGGGDDDLGLAVSGVGNPEIFEGLVDGGAGDDIARVTRNVRVRNVEEVIFLEG